jgi:hypothetical protein
MLAGTAMAFSSVFVVGNSFAALPFKSRVADSHATPATKQAPAA